MILEVLKMAFNSIWANKARSFLTMLGVIIGIFSVVILVAAVQGVKKQATDLISGLGPTTLIVIPGATLEEGTPSFTQGLAGSTLTQGDFEALQKMENADEFHAVAFVNALTTFEDKKAAPFVLGNTIDTEKLFKLILDKGQLISDEEYKNGEKVALAGVSPLEKLGITDPLGKKIKLGKDEFKIKGTYTKSDQFLLGFNLDDIIVIPLKAASEFRKSELVDRIYVVANNENSIAGAKSEIKDILLDRHKGEEDFSILEQKDALSLLGNITNILSALLGGIAAISLVVGGIGIMNIMLVSVTERTREIGLRKAVGATDNAIMLQFLIEAVLITVIGAAIGLGLAILAAYIASLKTPVKPDITLNAVLWAAGVSIAVGIIFGLFPAYRAAKKNPIDALRYE